MTRRSSSGPAVAAGAALAAAAALLALWMRRRRTAAGAAAAAEPPAARRPWSCTCGQGYEVTGTDRHRVYWLAGADEADPVLGQQCPACGTSLPGEHEAASL